MSVWCTQENSSTYVDKKGDHNLQPHGLAFEKHIQRVILNLKFISPPIHDTLIYIEKRNLE